MKEPKPNKNPIQDSTYNSQGSVIKHEEKICPNCLRIFECKVGSIQLCQCTKVQLTKEETEYLATQYTDCLCFQCMETLAFEYRMNQKLVQLPWKL
ncbi:cysteine-rich CWC family protein [Leptospira ellinghausenii]|uniref:cysteine-rich CWC family protein n=1 Tax=Leptospira ellinghausenii TaxID=1917822 RepID=UPI001FE90449|nr:cysteine-rich CWC family protein [Leptospira ellinghausenii]